MSTRHHPDVVVVAAPRLLLHLLILVIIYATTMNTMSAQRLSNRCQTIQVPMCKGLVSYNNTKLPNRFGHQTQTEVYWALQPWWPFIDAGCSDNLREFLCGLYLPRCIGDDQNPHYPCIETCRKAKVRCSKQMRREGTRWSSRFQCNRLLPKSSRQCIRPQREKRKNKNRQYVLCERNDLSMCHGIPFTQGSLPNMFLQSDVTQIEREMQQFKFLVDSGCSKKLRLFMCGAYMPFCIPGQVEGEIQDSNVVRDTFQVARSQPDVPFVVPCRELCQEVYDQCSGEYQQGTHGLPWPGKFHCHRYPSYNDRYNTNTSRRHAQAGASVPCTMPPYNYDGN